MKATKSQLNELTAVLEEEQPARADVELLDDGSLLVTLYRDGEVRHWPYHMRRLDRRGGLLRAAIRTATGWTEFTGPVGLRPPHRDDHEGVTHYVRGDG